MQNVLPFYKKQRTLHKRWIITVGKGTVKKFSTQRSQTYTKILASYKGQKLKVKPNNSEVPFRNKGWNVKGKKMVNNKREAKKRGLRSPLTAIITPRQSWP